MSNPSENLADLTIKIQNAVEAASPKIWEATLKVAYIDGLYFLSNIIIVTAIGVASFYFARLFYGKIIRFDDNDTYRPMGVDDANLGYMVLTWLSYAIALGCSIFFVVNIFNPWTWIPLYDPALSVAHKAMEYFLQ